MDDRVELVRIMSRILDKLRRSLTGVEILEGVAVGVDTGESVESSRKVGGSSLGICCRHHMHKFTNKGREFETRGGKVQRTFTDSTHHPGKKRSRTNSVMIHCKDLSSSILAILLRLAVRRIWSLSVPLALVPVNIADSPRPRTHTRTHAHMHTCTHVHMHTCTHAHMHTCTHTQIHARFRLTNRPARTCHQLDPHRVVAAAVAIWLTRCPTCPATLESFGPAHPWSQSWLKTKCDWLCHSPSWARQPCLYVPPTSVQISCTIQGKRINRTKKQTGGADATQSRLVAQRACQFLSYVQAWRERRKCLFISAFFRRHGDRDSCRMGCGANLWFLMDMRGMKLSASGYTIVSRAKRRA